MAVVIIEDPPVGRVCTITTPAVVTPFNSDTNPAQYNVEGSCDYQVVTVCDGSYDLSIDVDIDGRDLSVVGVAIFLNGTSQHVQGGASVGSLGLSVLYTEDTGSVTVEILPTSPIYSSLCGLCGTSSGQLVDKEGNVVPLTDKDAVNAVVESYRLTPEWSQFNPARVECGEWLVTSETLLHIDMRAMCSQLCQLCYSPVLYVL